MSQSWISILIWSLCIFIATPSSFSKDIDWDPLYNLALIYPYHLCPDSVSGGPVWQVCEHWGSSHHLLDLLYYLAFLHHYLLCPDSVSGIPMWQGCESPCHTSGGLPGLMEQQLMQHHPPTLWDKMDWGWDQSLFKPWGEIVKGVNTLICIYKVIGSHQHG